MPIEPSSAAPAVTAPGAAGARRVQDDGDRRGGDARTWRRRRPRPPGRCRCCRAGSTWRPVKIVAVTLLERRAVAVSITRCSDRRVKPGVAEGRGPGHLRTLVRRRRDRAHRGRSRDGARVEHDREPPTARRCVARSVDGDDCVRVGVRPSRPGVRRLPGTSLQVYGPAAGIGLDVDRRRDAGAVHVVVIDAGGERGARIGGRRDGDRRRSHDRRLAGRLRGRVRAPCYRSARFARPTSASCFPPRRLRPRISVPLCERRRGRGRPATSRPPCGPTSRIVETLTFEPSR